MRIRGNFVSLKFTSENVIIKENMYVNINPLTKFNTDKLRSDCVF